MKLFLVSIFICIYTINVCTAFKTIASLKAHCETNPDEPLTDTEIQRNSKFFDAIRGISSQALNDFKSVTKRQCIIYHPLLLFTTQILLKELNGRSAIINPVHAYNKFQKHKVMVMDSDQLLQEIENISPEILNAEQKSRFKTFFKGFSANATLEDVNATFAYLYGTG